MSWDMFKSAPPTVQVRLESNPPGADATTSLGAGCKTPCSVSVPAPDAPFTVAFALPKYQPASVPVNVIKNPGDFTTPASVTTDPNPVFAELQPAVPPKPVKKPHRRRSRSRPQPPRRLRMPHPLRPLRMLHLLRWRPRRFPIRTQESADPGADYVYHPIVLAASDA